MRNTRPVENGLLVLSASSLEAASIADLARQLAGTSPTACPEQFLRLARLLVDGHPALGRIRAALRARPSVCRIRGLQVSTSEPTPIAPISTLDNIPVPAATLGLVASLVGLHRGFERESSGRLIHSVAPIQANQDLQISSSSSVELEMHTEIAYAEHTPDFVLLLCAKQGAESAATLIAPLSDILRELSGAVLRTLFEPRFMTSVDVVVRDRPERKVGPNPLLYRNGCGDVAIRCDFGEAEATDNASNDALATLRTAARHCVRRIVLDEGDLLVVDNRRALHGRMPFAARFDGTDRWLLRSYVWSSGDKIVATELSPVVPATVLD